MERVCFSVPTRCSANVFSLVEPPVLRVSEAGGVRTTAAAFGRENPPLTCHAPFMPQPSVPLDVLPASPVRPVAAVEPVCVCVFFPVSLKTSQSVAPPALLSLSLPAVVRLALLHSSYLLLLRTPFHAGPTFALIARNVGLFLLSLFVTLLSIPSR